MRTRQPRSLLIAAVATAAAVTAAVPAAAASKTAAPVAIAGRPGAPHHGVRVSVHLRAGAPRSQRSVPKYTLTVTGTDLAGAPDKNGTAWVISAANQATVPLQTAEFRDGVAKVTEPAGTYWVVGEFDNFSKTIGGLFHLDFLPQIQVQRNTTVHTAANAATSEVTMATPRPAMPVFLQFEADLTDRLGSATGIDWFQGPGQIWVSPVARKPGVGKLQVFAEDQMGAPVRSGTSPYGYNLDYADPPGVIPPQHYVVRPSSLAVITDRYYQDVKSSGAWLITGGFPGQAVGSTWIAPLALPGTQTQYFSTAPDLYWAPGYNAFLPTTEPPVGGQDNSTYQVLHAGEHEVVGWNRFPLHPQPGYAASGNGALGFPILPSALRMGNKLMLTVRPFSDNVPGHLGAGWAPGSKVALTYQIDQNGAEIAHGSGFNGPQPVTLSSSPSVIRFVYDATRTGPDYVLSTHSHTVWTWRSSRQPGATVPAAWYCAYVHGKLIRRCGVQSMMTLDYQVQGLSLNGTAPHGRQLVGLTVGHIQLASAAPVTGAKAWASCEDTSLAGQTPYGSRTWRRATVSSLGHGRFALRFSVPSGCYVTLRVSATDAAGGSITETITRGYATTH